MLKYFLSIIITVLTFFHTISGLYAADWDDLDEGEKTWYGSEKEIRFPINAGIIENESWDDHYSLMVLGLYKSTDYPKYRSLRVLPFYYHLESKIDSRKRTFIPAAMTYWSSGENWNFSISPLHYNDHYSGAYDRSIMWFIWHGSSADKTSIYNGVFPIYGYARSKSTKNEDLFFISPVYFYQSYTSSHNGIYTEKNHLSPFHYYDTVNRDSTGENNYTFWFPIIPLFYKYQSGTSPNEPGYSHTNLLWLFDLKTKGDSLERIWAVPLFFYNPDDYLYLLPFYMGSKEGGDERSHRIALVMKFTTGKPAKARSIHLTPLIFHRTMEGGYRYYLPFYFRPSGWSEARGLSFGLTHYHQWSPEKDILWFLPYYSWDDKTEKKHFTLLLPLYSSWKLDNSSGTINPWSVSYRDKKSSLEANVLGFSWSASGGRLPEEVWGSADPSPWYLDTDFSFFYNIFSLSDRTSFTGGREKPEEAEEPTLDEIEENKEKLIVIRKPEAEKGTRITKKHEFSRDSSISFSGWQFLFGLAAYEKGDSKRHFRLLPLSWLTWDESSDDRLKVIAPVYYSYTSESDDIDYMVVFPFYGAQRDGESYARAYLLNAYWDEYSHEEKRSEQSVLWPVYNRYSSPDSSGFRIFPLYWHKRHTKDKFEYKKDISPILFYVSSSNDTETKKVRDRFHITPVWYYNFSESGGITESVFWAPLIPLYYSDYDSALSEIKGEPGINVKPGYDRSSSSWLIPVWYNSSYTLNTSDNKTYESASWFILPLLLYYGYETGSIAETGEVTSHDYKFFMAGFYKTRSPDKEITSLFYALYAREYYSKLKKHETTLLYGMVKSVSDESSSMFRLFPLWHHSDSPSEKSTTLALGLWRSEEKKFINRGIRDEYFHLLWGVYNSSHSSYMRSSHRVTDNEYYISESDRMLLPIFYSDNILHKDGGNPSKIIRDESSFWFPIIPIYYNHIVSEGADQLAMKVHTRALFPVCYSSTDSEGTHTNLFLLADWQKTPDGKLERFWLLPFYLYYPDTNSTVIFPVLLSGYKSDELSTTKVILGSYWYSSENHERQNLWLLYDHEKYLNNNSLVYEKFNYLLYTITYRDDLVSWNFKILGGLGASAWSYNEKNRWGFDLMYFIASVERNENIFSTGIFPLWYYKTREKSWWALSLATMSYLSKDHNSDFDLALLGTLYYRDRDLEAKKDLRMVLLGTLWHERVRPENGYHSRGMFWGMLWDYETESETGFRKISVLKGLYKRVELEGNVKTKYFWIF